MCAGSVESNIQNFNQVTQTHRPNEASYVQKTSAERQISLFTRDAWSIYKVMLQTQLLWQVILNTLLLS